MQYVIGAIAGAALAALLGIPSFTVDAEDDSEPPLLGVYCDLTKVDPWEPKCEPGAGTAVIILAGAGIGAACGAAIRGRKSEQSPEAGGTAQAAQKHPGSGLYPGLGSKIDDLIREAALDLVRNIDNRKTKSVPFDQVYLQIDSRYRDRARQLGIGDLAKRALDAAVEDGMLIHKTGLIPRVSRTSQPLPSEEELADSAMSSDHATAPQEDPEKSRSDAAAPTGQASETERPAPALLEELENLIRLHERGVLTDAELGAARTRLLSNDDG